MCYRLNYPIMKKILIPVLSLVIIMLLWQCRSTRGLSINQLSKGQWTEVKSVDGSVPVERHEAAFVGLGHRLYLLGGRGDKPTSIYDFDSQTWTQGAEPPIEMHHFQPVVYGGNIYVAGAMTGGYPGETPVPHIYIYNPQLDAWREGPEIPEDRRRGGAGAVLHGDKLYLVCGIKDGHRGDHKKWLDVYDFKSDRWEVLPDAPRPRDHFQALIVNDKLYGVGGRTTVSADNPFKNTIGEVDVFDLQSGSWSTLENHLPTPRAGNFIINLGEEILVLGGESFSQEPAHAEVESLNVRTGRWKTLPSQPQGRHGTGVVLYQNKLYTSSGSGNRGGGPELADLWMFSF